MEQELDTYVKVRKDEYDELKKLERNHRYLLSGELSYSNSLKNEKQELQNKNIELLQNLKQLKKELEEEKYLHQLDEKTEDLYRNLYLEERQKFYNLKEWLEREITNFEDECTYTFKDGLGKTIRVNDMIIEVLEEVLERLI